MRNSLDFTKWDARTALEYPAVTVFPTGLIKFNAMLAKKLRLWGMKSARLAYDPKTKRIAIRAFDYRSKRLVSVHHHLKSLCIKSKTFSEFWRIFPRKERRFHCFYDTVQNAVIVELENPVPPGRRRGW